MSDFGAQWPVNVEPVPSLGGVLSPIVGDECGVIDERPVFLCHMCGSWVDFSEGGDGCAQEGSDTCECWPGCFFLCAGCWCERAERFASVLPAERPPSRAP